jgi:hypothetical protein
MEQEGDYSGGKSNYQLATINYQLSSDGRRRNGREMGERRGDTLTLSSPSRERG